MAHPRDVQVHMDLENPRELGTPAPGTKVEVEVVSSEWLGDNLLMSVRYLRKV